MLCLLPLFLCFFKFLSNFRQIICLINVFCVGFVNFMLHVTHLCRHFVHLFFAKPKFLLLFLHCPFDFNQISSLIEKSCVKFALLYF